MPQGYVLKGRLRVRTNHAGESADLLASDGVSLVWHGGGALLLFAEELFRFPDFGALQMADLCRNPVEGTGNDGQRCDIIRVTVALNDLRGDRRDFQAEPFTNLDFKVRIEVGTVSHCAGELTDSHFLCRAAEAI